MAVSEMSEAKDGPISAKCIFRKGKNRKGKGNEKKGTSFKCLVVLAQEH